MASGRQIEEQINEDSFLFCQLNISQKLKRKKRQETIFYKLPHTNMQVSYLVMKEIQCH